MENNIPEEVILFPQENNEEVVPQEIPDDWFIQQIIENNQPDFWWVY